MTCSCLSYSSIWLWYLSYIRKVENQEWRQWLETGIKNGLWYIFSYFSLSIAKLSTSVGFGRYCNTASSNGYGEL